MNVIELFDIVALFVVAVTFVLPFRRWTILLAQVTLEALEVAAAYG
jgi:hypothetical protein